MNQLAIAWIIFTWDLVVVIGCITRILKVEDPTTRFSVFVG